MKVVVMDLFVAKAAPLCWDRLNIRKGFAGRYRGRLF
jgi:hypothetical protein